MSSVLDERLNKLKENLASLREASLSRDHSRVKSTCFYQDKVAQHKRILSRNREMKFENGREDGKKRRKKITNLKNYEDIKKDKQSSQVKLYKSDLKTPNKINKLRNDGKESEEIKTKSKLQKAVRGVLKNNQNVIKTNKKGISNGSELFNKLKDQIGRSKRFSGRSMDKHNFIRKSQGYSGITPTNKSQNDKWMHNKDSIGVKEQYQLVRRNYSSNRHKNAIRTNPFENYFGEKSNDHLSIKRSRSKDHPSRYFKSLDRETNHNFYKRKESKSSLILSNIRKLKSYANIPPNRRLSNEKNKKDIKLDPKCFNTHLGEKVGGNEKVSISKLFQKVRTPSNIEYTEIRTTKSINNCY